MARRTLRRCLAGALAVAAAAGLPGCSPASTEVVAAGLDADGTPVVAAERCGGDRGPLAAVVVRDLGAPGQPVIWQIEDAAATTTPTTAARPRELVPPPTVPVTLGPVDLVAVGDPAPSGWTVATPLEGPLPPGGQLGVEVHHHDVGSRPSEALTIDLDGGEDRYDYVADASSGSDVTGAMADAVIEEECAGTDAFDDGRFATVLGVGGGGLVVLAVLVGVVTVRQYRRAGEARART